MRMLMKVSVPTEAGNRALKDGTLAKVIGDTMERIHPEAAYFVLEHGKRTALFFFDLKEMTQVSGIVEPIYGALHADVELTPVMSATDLKAGLDAWQRAS